MSTAPLISYAKELPEDGIEDGMEDGMELDLVEGGGGVPLTDAVAEIKTLIDRAVDFIQSEMIPKWEDSERLYNGATNVPKVAGRSQVTVTKVRDTIRAVKPSIMRVFMTGDRIAEYVTFNPALEPLAEQQTWCADALFWESAGYKVLLDIVYDSCVKGTAITKTVRRKKVCASYLEATGLTLEKLVGLKNSGSYNIQNVYQSEISASDLEFPGVDLYDVEMYYISDTYETVVEHVPLWSFFIDEDSDTCSDGRIIGQRTNMTVGEAMELGLYANWDEINSLDVEINEASGESESRRGYYKNSTSGYDSRVDISQKMVLITECYVKYDLDGVGVPQTYRFWMGGTSYQYIDHERVDENPYDRHLIDPKPNSFFGPSLTSIVAEDQDTMTSLMRATCDNAHLSNNKRIAANPALVNMQDLMNPKIGAPIRVRQAGQLQEIGVTSSVGAMLPLINHLQANTEIKAGVTAAASGLDPDALQSTGKEAVMNTVQLGQGQVELMARNLAETGLCGVFRKLLKIDVAHSDPQKVMKITGNYVAIDTSLFDCDMAIQAATGLGTADIELRRATLSNIIVQQKEILSAYGPGNPIVSMEQMHNAISDLARLNGILNISRYISKLSPPQTADFARQLDEKTQKAEQDSASAQSKAYIAAEQIKAQARITDAEMRSKLQAAKLAADAIRNDADNQAKALITKMETDKDFASRMLDLVMKDDLARDKMAQDLYETELELAVDLASAKAKMEQEQERSRKSVAREALNNAT